MFAAYVGGLPHAVARYVREPAAERLCDTRRQRRLAHAGRPGEAENDSPRVPLPAAHGKVFEDALLRLPESEVPFVEDAAGAFEIERVHLAAGPRQVGQAPQVLHRLRVGLVRQAVELGLRLRAHRPGHAAHVELAAQSGDRVLQLRPGIPELLLQKLVAARSQASFRGIVPPVHQHALVALDPGLQGACVDPVRRHHVVEGLDHERVQRAHAGARSEYLEPFLLEADRNLHIRNPPDQAHCNEVSGHVEKQNGPLRRFVPALAPTSRFARHPLVATAVVLASDLLDRLQRVQQIASRNGVDARRLADQLHEVSRSPSKSAADYAGARQHVQARLSGAVPRGDRDGAERADLVEEVIVCARLAERGAELDDGRGRLVSQLHDGVTPLDEPEKRVRTAHRQRRTLVGEQDRIRKLEGRQRRHVDRLVAEVVHDAASFVEAPVGEQLAQFLRRKRGGPGSGPTGELAEEVRIPDLHFTSPSNSNSGAVAVTNAVQSGRRGRHPAGAHRVSHRLPAWRRRAAATTTEPQATQALDLRQVVRDDHVAGRCCSISRINVRANAGIGVVVGSLKPLLVMLATCLVVPWLLSSTSMAPSDVAVSARLF